MEESDGGSAMPDDGDQGLGWLGDDDDVGQIEAERGGSTEEPTGGLGWLGDGDTGLNQFDESGAEPSEDTKEAITDDVMDWLAGGEKGGETLHSNASAEKMLNITLEDSLESVGGDDEDSLGFLNEQDWAGSSDASATAISAGPTKIVNNEAGQGGESMFSSAIDDFFSDVDDTPLSASSDSFELLDSSSSMELSASTEQRVQRNRVDRIVNTLLRYLTRKEAIRQEQIDSIFRLTVGKVVDAVKAEVVAVYFLNANHEFQIGHVFYSKNLFKKERSKRRDFQEHLSELENLSIPVGRGIIGKCLNQKVSITSHDVQNDPDYVEIIGKDSEFNVRTMLTIPIRDGLEIFGAIQLMNKDEGSGQHFFSTQDSDLLEEIATYSARIIHRAKNPAMVPSDREMAGYISRLSKCEMMEFGDEDREWDEALWGVIGKEAILKWKILPIRKIKGKRLRVCMANPLDFQRRAGFEAVTGHTIEETIIGVKSAIEEFINAQFNQKVGSVNASDIASIVEDFKGVAVETPMISIDDDENSGPMVKLANKIIEGAYELGASDIHIEPFEHVTRVRYRVDGVLTEVYEMPQQTIQNLVSRIKIMSNLDISERRIPQDGKIKFKQWSKSNIDIDLRVATGPMAFGEKVCMRLLVKGNIALGLDAMGFSPENMELYRWAASQPYGMILNVGPTGSGKTTTLYSALSEVSTPDINVHTAEDPIEYPLHGINQMQMNKDIGLTFGTALKCFLRMDPDVILVGEIRDLETGEIAIEAALTGHLLFSTLHTNDAAGTIVRFIEMGIEPFMVSSSILLVCAQRLLRRLCKHCKVEWEPSKEELFILEKDPRILEEVMYKRAPKGCKKCGDLGYKGRVGIHEALTLNEELRELINQSASSDYIKDAARRNGMLTMFQDALWKTKGGICDLEEVLTKIRQDGDIKR
jgi:type II secretory ATPase GspE/PulE/Tfp pilus assembly ATPase PilB-like protein